SGCAERRRFPREAGPVEDGVHGTHEPVREHRPEREPSGDGDADEQSTPAAGADEIEEHEGGERLDRRRQAQPSARARFASRSKLGGGREDECEENRRDIEVLKVALERLAEGGYVDC